MNPIIKALRDELAKERDELANKEYTDMWSSSDAILRCAFSSGHEAATARLLTIVQKAVEMADFYDSNWRSDVYVGPTEELLNDSGKKAREFLSSFSETADASGKISKHGHYTIDAESFDKLVEDLQSDKEPSEQVKKAREKFLQIKKESGDGN